MKYIFSLLLLFIYFPVSSFSQWTNQNSGTTNFLTTISFPSIDTGYAIGSSIVIKTTNGGANWNLITGNSINAYNLYFTTADTGFAYGSNAILKTTNGGLTWTNNLTDSVWAVTSIHFPSANIGYAVGVSKGFDSTIIFKTINTGNSWSKVSIIQPFSFPASAIFFSDVNIGYYAGGMGLIYNSTDGGVSWVQQFSSGGNYQINSINFPAKDTGYAVGNLGKILKTTDGGTNWIQQTNPNSDPLYSVFFTDTKRGWAVGGNGINSGPILRTSDGGTTWTLSTNSSNTLNSVYFPSDNIGYVCGLSGTIMKFNGSSGIFEQQGVSFVNTYPNPTTGKFYVDVQGEISIYNSIGELIIGNSLNQNINLSSYPKGIYFIKVISEKNTYSEKIIIQ